MVSYLMEATEDWANDYAYNEAEKLAPVLENCLAQGLIKRKNGEITMAKLRPKFDRAIVLLNDLSLIIIVVFLFLNKKMRKSHDKELVHHYTN
ncbi:MAG: hypothetical protein N3B16_09720 [Candidatus Aminicenantes bacterium]|nr:hypothetical protein [Candidatus Aminicenantes bacterium]